MLVWNDPINLMSYVTFVFQKLFGYSLEKATAAARDAEKALNDPSRGLIRQAERLRSLGISPKKRMPARLSSEDTGEQAAAAPSSQLDSQLPAPNDDEIGSVISCGDTDYGTE